VSKILERNIFGSGGIYLGSFECIVDEKIIMSAKQYTVMQGRIPWIMVIANTALWRAYKKRHESWVLASIIKVHGHKCPLPQGRCIMQLREKKVEAR
jgi:hypothetical protein